MHTGALYTSTVNLRAPPPSYIDDTHTHTGTLYTNTVNLHHRRPYRDTVEDVRELFDLVALSRDWRSMLAMSSDEI